MNIILRRKPTKTQQQINDDFITRMVNKLGQSPSPITNMEYIQNELIRMRNKRNNY